MRNDSCRYLLAPTISYTQKLENRVRELEGLLELRGVGDGGPSKQNGGRAGDEGGEGDSSSSGLQPASGVVKSEEKGKGKGGLMSHDGLGTFDGLKRDEKGGITYHGATSFFQLPTPAGRDANERSGRGGGGVHPGFLEAAGGGERKERLVNNAWQQRAMETFSETPVSYPRSWSEVKDAGGNDSVGTVSIFVGGALVLDPAAFQFCVQTGFHTYDSSVDRKEGSN